jgi:hypothetical protein
LQVAGEHFDDADVRFVQLDNFGGAIVAERADQQGRQPEHRAPKGDCEPDHNRRVEAAKAGEVRDRND